MSSRRWRNGGREMDDDVEAVIEVLAKFLLADGRFQIAMGGGDDADVERNVFLAAQALQTNFCCSTRSSLTWVPGVMSPISSRKIVPRWACSKRPMRRACAPVNAPFSWPKSSLSSSVSGMAAQLTAMNGALARSLC